MIAVLLLLVSIFFHTNVALDDWFEEWAMRADYSLSPGLLDELDDMKERHPYWGYQAQRIYLDPQLSAGHSWSVGQWRPLVEQHFPASEVDTAMRVMNCETGGTGNPDSYNDSSGASGLFQHLPKYWAERSEKAGWGGADIMDPEANVAVAAWLADESIRGHGWTHWTCY